MTAPTQALSPLLSSADPHAPHLWLLSSYVTGRRRGALALVTLTDAALESMAAAAGPAAWVMYGPAGDVYGADSRVERVGLPDGRVYRRLDGAA